MMLSDVMMILIVPMLQSFNEDLTIDWSTVELITKIKGNNLDLEEYYLLKRK